MLFFKKRKKRQKLYRLDCEKEAERIVRELDAEASETSNKHGEKQT
jgi:hypothetical protein